MDIVTFYVPLILFVILVSFLLNVVLFVLAVKFLIDVPRYIKRISFAMSKLDDTVDDTNIPVVNCNAWYNKEKNT